MENAAATTRPANEVRFLGSHDLAIELLASHVNTLHPEIHFRTSFVGSLAGLMALECRDADIAGSHLMDSESGEFNIPFIERLMPIETTVVINLVQRTQGLILAPGNPKNITGIPDLRRKDTVFVNRQKGSGTRMFLDSQLLILGITPTEIKGYEREEKSHVAVANLVAQGLADVGLGAQSAANAVSLDFIPLLKERFDLITFQQTFEEPDMQKVLEVVRSRDFQKMLGSMPGYDLSQTGSLFIVKPKIGRKEST